MSDYNSGLFHYFIQWTYFATLPEMEDLESCARLEFWAIDDALEAILFKNSMMEKIYYEFHPEYAPWGGFDIEEAA